MRINNTFTKFFITICIIIFALLIIVSCGGSAFQILVEEGAGDTDTDTDTDTTPPEVVSVYSTAYNKLRIEFSEEVDTITASTASNYTITDLEVSSVAIDSDGKVVRLTTAVQLNQSYNIQISANIQDLSANAMASAYSGSFNGAVEEPRVANVTTLRTDMILVEFSEDVDTTTATDEANYSISPDAGAFSAVHPPTGLAAPNDIYNGDFKYALITLTAEEMQPTSYTLTINDVDEDDSGDIKDTAGFFMHPLYSSKSFQGDARPKVAMINSGSITTIRVKFTEDVDETSAENDSYYSVALSAGGGALTITGVARDATENSIVTITHTEDQTQDASYQVVINDVEDLNGNTVATDTSGYFLGNGPPSVASAAASGPTKVIVTFSEPIIAADDAETIDGTNYIISGLTITGAAWPSGGAGDRTVVELTTSPQLQQIYTLVLDASVLHAEDDSTAIAAGYNAVSFQGDGYPTVSSAMAIDPNTVKVVFSESVDLTTAQNTANYTVTSTGYPSLTINSADRQADPYSSEVILTTSTQIYVNYTVTVKTDTPEPVSDTTGNAITGNNTANFAGIGTDNTPPDIISVSASGTTVRVYFNEAVEQTTAEEETNYTLSNRSTATLTVNADPAATLDQTLQIDVGPGPISSITIVAGDSEDLTLSNPQFLRGSGTTGTEVIAYSIVSAINADPLSPVMAYVNGNKVELISRTFGTDGDISITNNLLSVSVFSGPTSSTQVNPGTALLSAGNDAQVDLTTGLAAGIYEVKIENVTDETTPPNSIAATTATVVIRGGETDPPDLVGAFATDETHIRLLFERPVDIMTTSDSSNFCIERELASFIINSSAAVGETLTLTYDGASTYILTCGSSNDPSNNEWKDGNTTVTTENIATVMNVDTDSPVWAHYIGSTIYIARRIQRGTGDTGALTNITSSIDFVDTGFDTQTAAYSTNNLTIIGSARNEAFPQEVILTLDSATPLDNSTTHLYGITATGIADLTAAMNKGYGGTRVVLPISSEITAPTPDTDAPEIVSAESLSDGLVRVIYSEPVEENSAETTSNYSISPTLVINSVVRDDTNFNIVLVYTELQQALTYTLTVNGVQDLAIAPNTAASVTASFTGMAAVTVESGPVGNTINGIGNVSNQAITAMTEFNNRLYIATYNSSSGTFVTEVYASDPTGVYFTQANYSSFAPPTSWHKQRQTTSLVVFGGKLWACTSDTPSEYSGVYYTSGGPTFPHVWTWDTHTITSPTWGNTYTKLLNYGISTPQLYVIEKSNLRYRIGGDNYSAAISGWDAGTPTRMIAFGGRMYVGVSNATTGMKVFRSTGADADAPDDFDNDFEQVLDTDIAGVIGMDGYDGDNATDVGDGVPFPGTENHYSDYYNRSVSSMAVFNGYIYIGTDNTDGVNSHGAQIWRSQDGLTWERVLDFGGTDFGGQNDPNNTRITSMAVSGNYLYAGTHNTTTGGEVWRSPDGVTWEQFGSNGFGSSSYTDVTAIYSFIGLTYICMEDATAGGAVFRASN